MEGRTTKRDFREKSKVDNCSLLGGLHGGPPPENFCIFELLRLDLLQFQPDFRSFSDKKGHY